MRGTEGEPVANARKAQAIEWLHDGVAEVIVPAATAAESMPLPESIDAPATARWIVRALAGETPIPAPIVAHAAACLVATGRSSDMGGARTVLARAIRLIEQIPA
jgi:anthranilate phosphoribosyltransferase